MKTKILAILPGLMVFANAAAQGDGGRYGGASALEQVQLPPYCYYLHVDTKYAAYPEYNIPRNCGVFMNHYCEGLIHLIRAQKATTPANVRKGEAGAAVSIIGKTLKSMTKECSIRADAEAALARARIVQAGLR